MEIEPVLAVSGLGPRAAIAGGNSWGWGRCGCRGGGNSAPDCDGN